MEEIKKEKLGDPDLGKAETPNLGKAETVNLGQAGNPVKEEPKKETPLPPPTDFKVAEIWIRSGQIMLDASESFWTDRCRALGVLDFCKDIVKTAQFPKKSNNNIIPVKGSFLNGIRNLWNNKRRR